MGGGKKKAAKGNTNNTPAATKSAPKAEPVVHAKHEGETVSDLIAAEEAAKVTAKAEKSAKKAAKVEDPFKPSADLAAEVAALQQTNQLRRNNVTRLTQERSKETKDLERVRGQLESRKKELVALRAQLEENEGRLAELNDNIVSTRERSEKKAIVIARREEIAHRNAFTHSTGAFANSNATTVRIGSAALASDVVSDDEAPPVQQRGRGRGGRANHGDDHGKKGRSSSKDIIGSIGVTIPAPRGTMRPQLSSYSSFDSSAMPQTPEGMPRSSPFADPVASSGYNVFSGGLGGSSHPSPFSGPSYPNRQYGFTTTPPSHNVLGPDMSSPDDSGASTPQPGGGFPSVPHPRSTLTPGAAPFEPSSINQGSSTSSNNNAGWMVTSSAPAPQVANLFASASKNAAPQANNSNNNPANNSSSSLQFQVTKNAVNMPPGSVGANGFVADPKPPASTPYYPVGAARGGQNRGGRGDFSFGGAEEYHPPGHPRNPQTAQNYYPNQSRAGQWGM